MRSEGMQLSVRVSVCVCMSVRYRDSGSTRAQMGIKQCLNLPDVKIKLTFRLKYGFLTLMALSSDIDVFDDNLARSESLYNLKVSAVLSDS